MERKGSMKAVVKAIRILELLLEHADGITLDEMSKLSGINKVTARRIALILMEHDYIIQAGIRGRYSIGLKFLDYNLIIAKNDPINRIANPFLIKLSKQVKETIILVIWDRIKAVQSLVVPVRTLLNAVPEVGRIAELHCTSTGKVIVAELPEAELVSYLDAKLKRFTANTITDLNDLKKHLLNIKQEGIAYDDEEHVNGVRSVAAVIKGRNGKLIGAIAIVGPSVRLGPSRLKEYTPVVQEYAREISIKLGYESVVKSTI
jgi:IclR family transcriptional regulator, KDG regulon repressor